MKFKAFGIVAVIACLHAGTATANTSVFPFEPNQQSYINYLNNNLEWDDGKKRVFTGLGGCKHYSNRFFDAEIYYCNYGYVKVTDPLGSKLCELQKLDSREFFGVVQYNSGTNRVRYGNEYPCKPI